MKNRMFGRVVFAGIIGLLAGVAFAADPQGTVTGRGYEITVTGADVTLNDADVAQLLNSGSNRDLYKLGTGRLVIDRSLSGAGYTANVYVKEGILQGKAAYVLGKSDRTVTDLTVEEGARLEFDASVATESTGNYFMPKNLYVAGTGLDGEGAIVGIGSTTRTRAVDPGVFNLAGDTLIKLNGQWGPRSSLDLNGHQLTLDGKYIFEICCNDIKSTGKAGSFVVQNGATLFFENTCQANIDPGIDIHLSGGAQLRVGGNPPPAYGKYNSGTLYVDGDASYSLGYWSGTRTIPYKGPVVLTGDLTCTAFSSAAATTMDIPDVISGEGGIIKKSASTLNLSNVANTFTGGITVEAGVVNVAGDDHGDLTVSGGTANVAGAVKGALKLTGGVANVGRVEGGVSGAKGTVTVDLSAETALTDKYLYGLWRNYSDNSTLEPSLTVQWVAGKIADKSGDVLQMPVVFPAGTYDYEGTLDAGLVATHAGADSVLDIGGEMTGAPNFKNYSGELRFSGEDQSVGWVDVHGGVATVAAGATVHHDANTWCLAAAYPETARLALYGQLLTTGAGVGIYCGRNFAAAPDNARAVVEIFDGATVQNPFETSSAGCNGWPANALKAGLGFGAYYQHGGAVTLNSNVGANYMGSGFPAFYLMEGGTMTFDSHLRVGALKGCTSVFLQTGGTITLRADNAQFFLGSNGGDAIYYANGGSLVPYHGDVYLCRENWENAIHGSHAIMTLDGEAVMDCNQGGYQHPIDMCRQNDCIAEANFNGGSVATIFGFKKNSGKFGNLTEPIVNAKAFVNFNGGTIRMGTPSPTVIIFKDFDSTADKVTVYEKGVTIDIPDGGQTWQTSAPLLAPSGKGVNAIPLPAAIAALGAGEYIGSPTVTITDPDGTGSGATAVALYDSASGKVTGFKVMNRGQNYTRAVATVSGGGYPQNFTIDCEVTDNVSGGLTKSGNGTLVLDKANTITGDIVLKGGVLRMGADGAISAASRLVLAGGYLEMKGFKLSDGSSAVTNWGADVPRALAEGTAHYTYLGFEKDAQLAVSGAEALLDDAMADVKRVDLLKVDEIVGNRPTVVGVSAEVAKEWKVRWVGNTLRASRPTGLCVLVK